MNGICLTLLLGSGVMAMGNQGHSLEPELSIVDVTAFGAVPNGDEDATRAVLAAIEACGEHERPVLRFQPGRYRFSAEKKPADGHALFAFRRIENLTIEGQGAELLFSGLTGCFFFTNCKNLTVRDLTIDWDRPAFSEGRILSATDRTFEVEIADRFPVKGGQPVQAFMDYDFETRRPNPDAVDLYYQVERTELVRPQVLRVHMKHPFRIPVGEWVVLRHQAYGFNAFYAFRSENLRFENVTVHHCPGMGFVADLCRDVFLDRFNVTLRSGSERMMTTTADATHFKRCGGRIELTDCLFEAMGDDGGNFGSLFVTLQEKLDDRTVLVRHNLGIPQIPEPGDTVEFTGRQDLLPYAEGTVESVVPDADGMYRLCLTEPLPEACEVGDVLANLTWLPSVRVRGCTVRNNRARGFLVQVRDAVIEDSTFEYCTSGGLYIMTEVVHFFEAIGTRNVTVRNCRFIHSGYSAVAGIESPISVYAYMDHFQMPPKPGVHRNTLIENCEIRGARNAGIFVAGADGITIRGNTITGVCSGPTREQGNAAIYIMSSRDAEISGNRIPAEEQGSAFVTPIRIGPGCEEIRISP